MAALLTRATSVLAVALVPLLLALTSATLSAAPPSPVATFGTPLGVEEGKTSPACPSCAQSKAPPPHTLPQALRAYIDCVCTHAYDKEAEPRSDEKKQEPEAGARGKNGEGGEDGKNGEKADKGGTKKDEDNGKKENGDNGKDNKEPEDAWYSAHAQATVVTQVHNQFPSPYVGPNSLLPDEPARTSMTGTLFLDVRLWGCGSNSTELVFNPETAGGRGFSNVMGIAGFPNGEISRVGLPEPTPYIARLFLRQTWGFGGEQEPVDDAPNQIAGSRDVERLTVLVGKVPPTDLVDDNRYSHDPRLMFLNWALVYNGAYDYPANVRGYDYGFGLDYNTKAWALRYGVFGEPAVANGAAIDPRILNANGHVLALEERYTLGEHPGKLRVLGFLNHAHMGNYREALLLMPVNPDIALTRAYRIKYGFGLNLEQELTKDLGLFARLGWNDGRTESWAFTEIDETTSVGLVLKGRTWCRPGDTVGLGLACNGLSPAHRDYLAASGLGFIIGDGRLNYSLEKVVELYYDIAVNKAIFVTFDFQEVEHPAYNKDRGPVAIGTIRVHFEF